MKKFDKTHVSEIIEFNNIECSRRNESFGVKTELLFEIINKINELSNIPDDNERILRQTSTLWGLVVFRQPFNNANKSTATAVAIDFLRSNGFQINVSNIKIQTELLDILEKIMYLFEDESEKGILWIKEFLEKHLRKLH
jgi:prophage maintenance system killer protein